MSEGRRPRLFSADDHDSDDEEEDAWEWVRLLDRADRDRVLELERARRAVDKRTIADNIAVLSQTGMTDTSRGSDGLASAAARDWELPTRSQRGRDTVGLSVEVDSATLVKLLPQPGTVDDAPSALVWVTILKTRARRAQTTILFMSIELLLAFSGCLLYIFEEYHACCPLKQWAVICEWAYFASYTAHLLVSLAASESVAGRIFTWDGCVDALCLVPTPWLIAREENLGFLRFTKLIFLGLEVSHHTSVPLLKRLAGYAGTFSLSAKAQHEALWRRGVSLGVVAVSCVCLMAGILNFIQIEQEGSFAYAHADSGSFGDSLYFSLVTILTVGYGDIVPVSALAKFATIACTLAIYYIVPSGIMEAIREHRYGQGAHDLGLLTSKGRNVREQHIVLCGSVTLDNLAATLREIFHSDHGAEMRWVRVIVLSNRKPTAEISVLLDSPTYRYRVAYVVGSPLNSKDLERARVEEAAGVMVLVDKMAANERLEDMDVMMQAISALSHVQVQRRAGHGPRLLVGLVLPTSALHLRTAGMRSVVSSVQLKLSILAQSCRCPGWAAMVSNLIRSHAKLPPEVLEAGSWLAEYYIGATKTFYSISFSPVFVGQLFSSVVATVFEHFELIIAAVEKPSGTVLLNPGPNYRIRKEDRAYVLAESQKDALAVWAYLGEFHEATKNGEQAKLLEAVARSKAAVSSAAGFIQSLRQGRMLLTCKARLRPGVLPMEEVAMAIVEVLQAGKAKVGVPVWDILAQCGMKIDQGSAKLQHASGRSVAISPAESRVAPPRRRSLLGMSGPVGRQLSDLVEESVWSVPSVREEEHSQASVPGAMSPLLSPPPPQSFAPRPVRSRPKSVSPRSHLRSRSPPQTINLATIGREVQLSDPASMTGEQAKAFLADLQARASDPLLSPQGGRWSKVQSRKHASATVPTSPNQRGGLPEAIPTAEHMSNHVVVMGFPPHTSHLECFLASFAGTASPPLVFMSPSTEQLLHAMKRLRVMRQGSLSMDNMYLLTGSPVSYQDLKRAGLASVNTVILLSNPSRGSFLGGERPHGDDGSLLDGEALLSFIKMSDGLIRPEANCIVELGYESNLRFLHTSSEIKALRALSLLGTDSAFLWPKFASGRAYCGGMLDTLLSQAFYRPSRIALIEQLLFPGDCNPDGSPDRSLLHQIGVPQCLIGHSFGELFQQLIAPPLCTIAFGLYRGQGTRGAPEPYVYTGPRADTVLHDGDRVFVLLPAVAS